MVETEPDDFIFRPAAQLSFDRVLAAVFKLRFFGKTLDGQGTFVVLLIK